MTKQVVSLQMADLATAFKHHRLHSKGIADVRRACFVPASMMSVLVRLLLAPGRLSVNLRRRKGHGVMVAMQYFKRQGHLVWIMPQTRRLHLPGEVSQEDHCRSETSSGDTGSSDEQKIPACMCAGLKGLDSRGPILNEPGGWFAFHNAIQRNNQAEDATHLKPQDCSVRSREDCGSFFKDPLHRCPSSWPPTDNSN